VFGEAHTFWQDDAEAVEERGLVGIWLSHSAIGSDNLTVESHWQHDVVRLNACEFFEHGARGVSETRAALPHLKALPQHESEEADQDMSLHAFGAGARSGASSTDPCGYERRLRPG
jgi:hypothetical protein